MFMSFSIFFNVAEDDVFDKTMLLENCSGLEAFFLRRKSMKSFTSDFNSSFRML